MFDQYNKQASDESLLKKAQVAAIAWVSSNLKLLKKSVTPSSQAQRLAWQVGYLIFITIATVLAAIYYGWLAITVAIVLLMLGLIEFGMMTRKLRMPLLLGGLLVPSIMFGSWTVTNAMGIIRQHSAETDHKSAIATLAEPSTPKPSADNPKFATSSPTGADEQQNHSETDLIVIPDPIAPARPPVTPTASYDQSEQKTDSKESGDNTNTETKTRQENAPATAQEIANSVPNCRFASEDKASELTQFQSGDFYVTLYQCKKKGDQIQFSGTVLYEGPGTSSASFGALTISSSNGKIYPLGKAHFGTSDSFGRGYSTQFVDKNAPIGFYVEATDVTDAPQIVSLSMPARFGPAARSQVVFERLNLGK